MTLRIGQGFDVHAFDRTEAGSDSFITLGGVQIAHACPLKAHSDGDVLLHALCDALLGALALGDIGQHFPDTDQRFANADSRELLRKTCALVIDRGFAVLNVDTTIIAQTPKMATHIPAMCSTIAADLGIQTSQVSVKATTTELLGFTGRSEGIACQAIVLLQSA